MSFLCFFLSFFLLLDGWASAWAPRSSDYQTTHTSCTDMSTCLRHVRRLCSNIHVHVPHFTKLLDQLPTALQARVIHQFDQKENGLAVGCQTHLLFACDPAISTYNCLSHTKQSTGCHCHYTCLGMQMAYIIHGILPWLLLCTLCQVLHIAMYHAGPLQVFAHQHTY